MGRLNAAYPQASRISVVLDTWSIHQHPDVQEALQALPRLDLVWLPTYAPWLNPIEKLWRWVRQDALYLHRDAGDWNTFQQHLHAFLEQFASRVQPKCLSMSACSETACLPKLVGVGNYPIRLEKFIRKKEAFLAITAFDRQKSSDSTYVQTLPQSCKIAEVVSHYFSHKERKT